MRRPLTRATAVTTAVALAVSLLAPLPANADEDNSPVDEVAESERDALELAAATDEPVQVEAFCWRMGRISPSRTSGSAIRSSRQIRRPGRKVPGLLSPRSPARGSRSWPRSPWMPRSTWTLMSY